MAANRIACQLPNDIPCRVPNAAASSSDRMKCGELPRANRPNAFRISVRRVGDAPFRDARP
jgi:hypothetical protein